MTVELVQKIVGFVGVLRRLGLRVGTSETIDALSALGLVDLLGRDQVRMVLATTLVKDKLHAPIFQAAFEEYFSAEEKQRQVPEELCGDEEGERLSVQGRPLDLEPDLERVYQSLESDERSRLQDFLDKTSQGRKVGPQHDALIVQLVSGHLRRMKEAEEKMVPQSFAETGDPRIDGMLSAIADRLSRAGELPLAYRDLGSIGPEERDRMVSVLRQLARKLATGLSRRYRLAAGRKQVDFRRTIRANVRFGGVMMRLKYRRRDVRRPRLVVLADVSGSMERYSEFVLLFVYGLMRGVSGVECFAFTEDLVRVDPGLRSGEVDVIGEMLTGVVRAHGQTTNLGSSLQTLGREYGDLLSSRTIVIVVSDTKTKAIGEATGELAEIARRVRTVLWLNTVPEDRWNKLPGVAAFSRYCVMRECYTLAQLNDIMRGALGAV